MNRMIKTLAVLIWVCVMVGCSSSSSDNPPSNELNQNESNSSETNTQQVSSDTNGGSFTVKITHIDIRRDGDNVSMLGLPIQGSTATLIATLQEMP